MIDWEGKAYDFILTRKKYSVKWKQRWTDYKRWGDFGGKWKAKAEVYYTDDELLKEITEPCYKFLWWELVTSLKEGQCGKIKYIGNVDLKQVTTATYLTIESGMYFTFDGKNLYIITYDYFPPADDYTTSICWFTLTTPWDLRTMQFKGRTVLSDNAIYRFSALYFSSNGQYFYVTHFRYDYPYIALFQYYLSKPWDITTAQLTNKKTLSSVFSDIKFNPDGTKLYAAYYSTQLAEYTLSTPWDISTIINPEGDRFLVFDYENIEPDTDSYYSTILNFWFKPDGKGIYIITRSGNVYYYDLPIPWSFSNYIFKGYCFNPITELMNSAGPIDLIGYFGELNNFWISNDLKFIYISFLYNPRIYIFTNEP